LEEIPEQNQPLWTRKLATLTPDVPVERLVIRHEEILNSSKSQIQQRVSSIKHVTLQQSVSRVFSFWTEILNRKLQKTEEPFYPPAGDVLQHLSYLCSTFHAVLTQPDTIYVTLTDRPFLMEVMFILKKELNF